MKFSNPLAGRKVVRVIAVAACIVVIWQLYIYALLVFNKRSMNMTYLSKSFKNESQPATTQFSSSFSGANATESYKNESQPAATQFSSSFSGANTTESFINKSQPAATQFSSSFSGANTTESFINESQPAATQFSSSFSGANTTESFINESQPAATQFSSSFSGANTTERYKNESEPAITQFSSSFSRANKTNSTPTTPIPLGNKLKSFIVNQDRFKDSLSTLTLESAKSKSLLQLKNFKFILNNKSICNGKEERIFFMIVVHSAPSHLEERKVIRSTWGSVKSLDNWGIRLIFLLGDSPDGDYELIEQESENFGDIVCGNFMDTYRNLTYKHMMGYKWVLNYCPEAKFILKTDDDLFIDIFQLLNFTIMTYGDNAKDAIVCYAYPHGVKPVRASDRTGLKWQVSMDEYPFGEYPMYCGGLAYLVSLDVARKVLAASEHVKFFWIDDVFVTGVLRELVDVRSLYHLNHKFAYHPSVYREWLKDRKPGYRCRKLPFIIAQVTRGLQYSQEVKDLWRKTLQFWS